MSCDTAAELRQKKKMITNRCFIPKISSKIEISSVFSGFIVLIIPEKKHFLSVFALD